MGCLLPDTYLIGAPKAGTTSIANWLAEHPDVYFSVPKEPYFWADDYPRLRSHYGFSDLASYRELFSSSCAVAAQVRAEGSTFYLYSETAVPNICAAVPDARFIVALRNPVDLVVSYHRSQVVALNESERDFGTAWHRSLVGELPDTDPLDLKQLDYPRVGSLGRAMSRLLSRVPKERVHVLAFDDLQRDPAEVWRRLTAFLALAAEPAPRFVAHNTSDKAARYPLMRRVAHRPGSVLERPVAAIRQWSRTTSVPGVRTLKQRMWRPDARPQLSAGMRAEVAAYFERDVELLASLTSVDTSGSLP